MKNGLYQNDLGIKIWYKDGQIHRVNGIADLHYTTRYYYYNGKYHRLDGPAIIYRDNTLAWVINGTCITDKLYQYCRSHNINIDNYMNLKLSDKLKLKFKFGLLL